MNRYVYLAAFPEHGAQGHSLPKCGNLSDPIALAW
jgi:hypothetical protein